VITVLFRVPRRVSTYIDIKRFQMGAGEMDVLGRADHRRRGVVLLAVMVCVLIAAAVVASLTRGALLAQRQFRARRDQLQAVWLAESAVERAVSRLATDADFRQETWSLGPDELGGRLGGTADIRVTALPDSRLNIRVTVEYPNHPDHRVRYRRDVTVAIEDQDQAQWRSELYDEPSPFPQARIYAR
jgi:hypothetical protein